MDSSGVPVTPIPLLGVWGGRDREIKIESPACVIGYRGERVCVQLHCVCAAALCVCTCTVCVMSLDEDDRLKQ